MNETIHRKIIIVGDSATGKTSIIERYINNKFSTNLATIVPHYYEDIKNQISLDLIWATIEDGLEEGSVKNDNNGNSFLIGMSSFFVTRK